MYDDSAMMMADRALHYNKNSGDAWDLKSMIYTEYGMFEESEKAAKKAIDLHPVHAESYAQLGYNYSQSHHYSDAVKYRLIALQMNREPQNNKDFYGDLARSLMFTGYSDIAEKYRLMKLKQDNDSMTYFRLKISDFWYNGHYLDALRLVETKTPYLSDTTKIGTLMLYAHYYMLLHNFNEMNRYFHLIRKKQENGEPKINDDFDYGFMCMCNGFTPEAGRILGNFIKKNEEDLKVKSIVNSNGTLEFNMATAYASWRKPDKCMEYLRPLLRFEGIPGWMVSRLNNYPCFDFMRERPEFISFRKELETRYQREREKTRKVLKEFDLI
jgi:tetratricopeptide (TPR) repeat protein